MKRKRLLLSLLLFSVLCFALYQSLDLLKVNEGLRRAVQARAGVATGGTLSVGRATLGFFSLHLKRVYFRDDAGARSLFIKDIKISISLRKLLKTRFNVLQSITRIEILRPQLKIASFRTRPASAPPPAAVPPRTPGETPAAAGLEIPVDSLIIRNGAILTADSGLYFPGIRDIQGHVILRKTVNLFSLSGKFLNAGKNITIQGRARPDFGEYNFDVQLQNASLEQPADLGGGVTLKSADIDVVMYFLKKRAEPVPIESMAGTLALKNGAVDFRHTLSFSSVNGMLRVENDTLKLDSLTGLCFDRRFLMGGFIRDFSSPAVDLHFSLKGVNAGHASLRRLLPGRDLHGTLSLMTDAIGKADSLSITGLVETDRARFGEAEVNGLEFSLLLRRDVLTLLSLRSRLMGGALAAMGHLHVQAPHDAALRFKGENLNLLQLAGVKMRGKNSSFKSSGEFTRTRGLSAFSAGLNGVLLSYPNLKRIRARIAGGGDRIAVSAANADSSLVLAGDIRPARREAPLRFRLTGRRLDLSLLSEKAAPKASENFFFNADMRVTGDLKRLKIESEADVDGRPLRGRIKAAGFAGIAGEDPEIDLSVSSDRFVFAGLKSPLSFRVLRDKASTRIEDFKFTPHISGRLAFSSSTLDGALSISRFNIVSTLNWESEWVKRVHPEGWVSGGIEFKGSPQKPEYSADLRMADGKFGALKPLSAQLSLTGAGRTADITALRVETPEKRLISSEGLRFTGAGLTGRLRIDKINLADILGGDAGIAGAAYLDYQCDKPGVSRLTATIRDLKAGKVRLSYLKADIAENQGRARIQSLSLGNENFSADASGFLPSPFAGKAAAGDSLNLEIRFKGDLLKQLAEITPAMDAGSRGIGEARLHFLGTYKSLTLENGFVDISKDRKATVKISRFLPDNIERLKVFAGINRRVAAVDMEGFIQDKKFRIVSEPGREKGRNFRIDLLNLDLGVFKVITFKGGVPVHLPGLMHMGEYGEFELYDKQGNPGLTLLGPLNSPVVSGKMRVSNCRFTFPFLVTGRRSAFLREIGWDLTVQPGNNMKYFYNHRKSAPMPFLDKLIKNDKLAQQIDRGLTDILEYPFTELTLDKESVFGIKGIVRNRTLKLSGRITSSKGYVHYYGLDYNRDVDVGVEFDGSNLRPVLWGSAVSEVRPTDRSKMGTEITLTLKVKDPATGAWLNRARFNEFKLVPSSDMPFDETGAPVDAYQGMLPGAEDRNLTQTMGDLARSEGKAMFEKIFLQRMVTNYVERAVLGFGRQTLNPLLGVNVTPDVFRIEIESDGVINYIDMSVWNFERLKKDLLENIEFITGKYFFGGTLFLNYSSQFEMAAGMDNMEVEKLHHRLGMELTPVRYLYFNMDYEIGGIPRAIGGDFSTGDIRSNVRLKMPLKKVMDIFVKPDKRK